MAINKPDLLRYWASGALPADVVDPDTIEAGKVASGWLDEIPPYQYINFIYQWLSQALAHLNERGVLEWDASTTYLIGALVMGSDGQIYISYTVNNGNNPTTDGGTNWDLFHDYALAQATINATAPMTVSGDLASGLTIAINAATEGAFGSTRYATAAETAAGIRTDRAVHPAGLLAALGAPSVISTRTTTGTWTITGVNTNKLLFISHDATSNTQPSRAEIQVNTGAEGCRSTETWIGQAVGSFSVATQNLVLRPTASTVEIAIGTIGGGFQLLAIQ